MPRKPAHRSCVAVPPAQLSNADLLKEIRQRSLRPVCEFSTDELLCELERRSLGLIVCATSVEDGLKDRWRHRVKGSHILLGAMHAVLTCHINRALNVEAEKTGGEP
jgi:hypothetical protein